jgi:hypothetical protein
VVVLACVVIFAIRGFLRGTIAQVFVVLGVLCGLWVAVWVSQWVGEQWRGARPAVVFLVLRWLVAALAGMTIASVLQWWGDRVGGAIQEGALGFFDRTGGLIIGALLGATTVAFVMMAGLLLRQPAGVGEAFSRARLSAPVMQQAARVCALGENRLPGSHWLKLKFQEAERRARRSGAQAQS